MAPVGSLQRRRRDVVAATPDLHLRLAVLLHGLGLVETLQRAVMAFVQAPAALHRQPHQVHFIEHDPHRANRTFEHRGENEIEFETFGFEQLACFFRFVTAEVGQIDIDPASEEVFQVPSALTVTDEYEFAGHN